MPRSHHRPSRHLYRHRHPVAVVTLPLGEIIAINISIHIKVGCKSSQYSEHDIVRVGLVLVYYARAVCRKQRIGERPEINSNKAASLGQFSITDKIITS